jgi:ribosomal protein S12 methylthiotransferase
VVESRYWLQTLGCPKNQVDSDKLAGRLAAQGYRRAADPAEADLMVVNTCAFIESARQESIEAVLELADLRSPGARLVVTGCMAERYGDELSEAMPEVDLVAGFGTDFADPIPIPIAVPVTLTTVTRPRPTKGFDLLELARPASEVPWAYVKVAEGCDRICGFCAIPSFRGKQRSRSAADIMAEVELLLAAGSGLLRAGPVAPRRTDQGRSVTDCGADPGRLRPRAAHPAALSLPVRVDR